MAKVLIVENEHLIALRIQSGLTNAGHEIVGVAANRAGFAPPDPVPHGRCRSADNGSRPGDPTSCLSPQARKRFRTGGTGELAGEALSQSGKKGRSWSPARKLLCMLAGQPRRSGPSSIQRRTLRPV